MARPPAILHLLCSNDLRRDDESCKAASVPATPALAGGSSMTSRWLRVAAALALLPGCGQRPEGNRQETPQPAPKAAPAPVTAPATSQNAEPADAAADLSGLSPSQRRAYDRGLADCRAGRYDPDPYPEAYRIGCAAAQDSKADRRPQG